MIPVQVLLFVGAALVIEAVWVGFIIYLASFLYSI